MNLRATLGGLLAIVLWSTSVALARSVSHQLGPLSAAAAVYTFGGVVGLGWSLVRQPAAMRVMLGLPRRYLLGCGGLFVFYTAAFFLALGLAEDHQQSIALGLVNYLWPALTILFSLPLLHARASWVLAPGTLLGLAGMAVVLSQGQSIPLAAVPEALGRNPLAFACALAAAVSWALYSNLARRWAGAHAAGAVPLFVLVAGVLLAAMSGLRSEGRCFTIPALVEAGLMGLTVPVAYACWDRAMRQGDMRLVSACSYLTPLLSTLVAAAYLHVAPPAGLWLGCAALVAGSLASWWAVEHPAA